MSPAQGLNRDEWTEKLSALGTALRAAKAQAQLEIIGAWPLIQAGMPGRTSLDLYVWTPGSQVDRGALQSACRAAGLDFDPTGETDQPYLQLISPGIVQMPEHTPQEAGAWAGLTLTIPPPAALAAAKLTRAEGKDIADVFFLCSRHGLREDQVATYIEKISDSVKRERARENLSYLRASPD